MSKIVALLLALFILLSVRAEGAVAVVWSLPDKVIGSFDVPVFEMEAVPWNSRTGFQINEPSFAVGWITYVHLDRFEYARVILGRDSGDHYLIFASSLEEYVADYGGANTWHTTGAYRVKDFEWGP